MSNDTFDFKAKPVVLSSSSSASSALSDKRPRDAVALRASAEAGEMLAMLARVEPYRSYSLADIEQLVRPVLASRQFCFLRGELRVDGSTRAEAKHHETTDVI